MSLPTIEEVKKSFGRALQPIDVKTALDQCEQSLEKSEIELACQISDPNNLSRSEEEYYQCAQDLRELGNYATARSILRSLVVNTRNSTIAVKAYKALDESIGDGGGFPNLIAYVWGSELREWSDEDDADVVRDLLIGGFMGVFSYQPVSFIMKRHIDSYSEFRECGAVMDRHFDHRPDPK